MAKVVTTFSRFQGFTRTHEEMLEFMDNTYKCDVKIFMSHTQNADNILPYKVKHHMATQLFPNHKDNFVNSEARTLVNALDELKENYDEIVFVCLSDNFQSFSKLISAYAEKNDINVSCVLFEPKYKEQCSSIIDFVKADNFDEFKKYSPLFADAFDVKLAFNVIKGIVNLQK